MQKQQEIKCAPEELDAAVDVHAAPRVEAAERVRQLEEQVEELQRQYAEKADLAEERERKLQEALEQHSKATEKLDWSESERLLLEHDYDVVSKERIEAMQELARIQGEMDGNKQVRTTHAQPPMVWYPGHPMRHV